MMEIIKDGFGNHLQQNAFLNESSNLIHSMEHWTSLATRNILPLSYEQDNLSKFRGNLDSGSIGNVQVAHIAATPHTVHRTKTMIKTTSHNVIVFNLLLSGNCKSEQDGQQSDMKSMSSWFCNASRPYTLEFRDDFDLISLVIPHSMLEQHVSSSDLLVSKDLTVESELSPFIQSQLKQFTASIPMLSGNLADQFSNNLVSSIATLINEHLSSSVNHLSRNKISTLIRLKQHLSVHLDDPELTPGSVADSLGISVRYINKLLLTENTSISRMIWNNRVAKASRLLKDPTYSGRSLSDIAYSIGFNDMTHFSKSFKAEFGMPPSRYREQYKTS